MTDKVVRTRFAPSPTGPLHIGGVRSALFGWLFARHHGGQFILRIEDTDQKRYVEGSLELITDALSWLGLDWDEGPGKGGEYAPYMQSERLNIYKKHADWLVENGKAYKCFCSSERLKQVNEEKQKRGEQSGYDRHCRNLSADEFAEHEAQGLSYVVRFKMPLDGMTRAHDLVLGDLEYDNSLLQDAVIMKSDGFPTYHLAHIVDDHLMKISHITRANEWQSSLPLHVNIWDAFGWEMPYFAHLPVLLNPNGKGKLSKRHSSFDQDGKKVLVLAKEFKDVGYLPEAVVNFLTNIGWNFGDDREVFTVEEAIERFDITDVNPANSAFPIEKLDWLNGVYIRDMPADELAKHLLPILEDADYEVNVDVLLQVAPIMQVRMKSLNDIVEMAGFFFDEWSDFQAPPIEMLIPKKMDADGTKDLLAAAKDLLQSLDKFDHQTQYDAMKILAGELGVKNGPLFGAIRVAVTGQKVSPPTFETMEILGKDESIRRIQLAIEQFD